MTTPNLPVKSVDDVAGIVHGILDMPPTPLIWLPWEEDLDPPAALRGAPAARLRILRELHLLGLDTGGRRVVGVDLKLGAWTPNRLGQVLAPADSGRRALNHLVENVRRLIREFLDSDLDMESSVAVGAREALACFERGTFSHEEFAVAVLALEVLGAFCHDGQLSSKHPWVVDPGLFASDAAVFPSEALGVDCIALVCDDGYALSGRDQVDKLFTFHGAAWNGRPKFSCEQATLKNRRAELKKKNAISRDDKIEIVDWITGTINQH